MSRKNDSLNYSLSKVSKKATVLFWAVLILLLSLSLWQYQRGHEKAIQLNTLHTNSQKILDVEKADPFLSPPIYTNLQATGCFDQNKIILLDNTTHNGSVGYLVIQGFHLAPCHQQSRLLPVIRGFIPISSSRDTPPKIPTPEGIVSISGIHVNYPEHFTLMVSPVENFHGFFRVQSVNRQVVEQAFNMPIISYAISLTSESLHHFEIIESIVYLNPERHYGYAVQWLLLAVTWILLFYFFVFRKKDSEIGHHKK